MAKTKRLTLRPILNHIIFIFEDELVTAQGVKQFKETTSWGFQLVDYKKNLEVARWGITIAVGPAIKDKSIEPGMRILIDALKWTEGVKFEGNQYWMTNEEHVMCIDDDFV